MFEEVNALEQRTCSAKRIASEILYCNIVAMQKTKLNLSQFEFGKFSARLVLSKVSFGLILESQSNFCAAQTADN